MTTKSKTYRSAREVFAEFIPNYPSQRSSEEKPRSPSADAHETAERLLAKFKSKVAVDDE